jgi:2'-5' RNA ligase
VRLFAAVELPGETRAALAAWGARVSAREPAVRLVPVDSLHVTLAFLGSQEDPDAIGQAVLACGRPLADQTVDGAAWLPARRPGVLVADLVREPSLLELQAGVAAALRPWHDPETRPYRPHVTVARVRRGERLGRREVAAPPRLTFAATALVLYRSHPGSEYEPLARAEL